MTERDLSKPLDHYIAINARLHHVEELAEHYGNSTPSMKRIASEIRELNNAVADKMKSFKEYGN